MSKLMLVVAIFTTLSLSTSALARNKVIYGTDDRRDVYQVSNPMFLDLARSTAAMIPTSKLSVDGSKTTVQGTLLSDRGICETAKFANQATSANCSGFLVAPDILVTAGHCYKSAQQACDTYKWVFDYNYDTSDITANIDVRTSDVYGCKEVIAQVLDGTQNDYAVIKLDREVEGRDVLTFRTEGQVNDGQHIVVIGHPTGLPTKIADNAQVRSNDNDVFFSTNLDTFGGNSGSAVFNATTGVVEGILVRGEQDYKTDWSQGGCKVVNNCDENGCRGEDVTRITNVAEIIEYAQ